MPDTQAQSLKTDNISLNKPLSGYIVYEDRPSGTYGKFLQYITGVDGTTKRISITLGRLINDELSIFRNRERGFFTFSLENGFGDIPESYVPPDPALLRVPKHTTLHFGNIWLVDQILKKTGLDSILDNLIPEDSDTLKSLVSFRLLSPDAYCYAEKWYSNSYANMLYSNAKVDSPRISSFFSKIGHDNIYRQFFKSYLQLITDNNKQITIPILLDSTGMPNDIKTHLTAVNNHHGITNNEIRLIYVLDKTTKLPIFFRYVPGNIIDNSTLINTLNILSTYNIDVELIIMDSGYYSSNNLSQLIASNVSFITRVCKNRKEYKELMAIHSDSLRTGKNAIKYNGRSLYGKKVPIDLYGKQLYAYILLDINKSSIEEQEIVQKYAYDSENVDKIDNSINSSGKFILLASDSYELSEILPLYYLRQEIEQVFDINKTFNALLPLRVHSEDTLRGALLISFIASIIYSYINQKLHLSKYCVHSVFIDLNNLKIEVYDNSSILQEFTKDQKEIFNIMQLDCPFKIENGNKFKKESFVRSLKENTHKRGRPKGSKNKIKKDVNKIVRHTNIINRKLGRPKGSKNRVKNI
jgi:hypothetical protein